MTRLHRPYGKGESFEEYGRDKGKSAKARKHRIRHNIKKLLKEAEAQDGRIIHCDLMNAYRL